MKKLNSPYITLLVVLAFLALCYRCYPSAPQELTYPAEPAFKQQGYDKKDAKQLRNFVALKIKQYDQIVTYRADLAELNNTTEETNAK